jgi:hypothetical protein
MPTVEVDDRSAYATAQTPRAQWPIGPVGVAEWCIADRTAAQSIARDRLHVGADVHQCASPEMNDTAEPALDCWAARTGGEIDGVGRLHWITKLPRT